MGDQEWTEGERTNDYKLSFAGKTPIQALNLLDAKCRGVEGVKSVVRCQVMNMPRGPEDVLAPEKPQGGLDNWVVAGLYIDVKAEGEELVSSVYSAPFPFGPKLICQHKGGNLGDSLRPLQSFDPGIEVLDHIQRGSLLHRSLLKETERLPRGMKLSDSGHEFFEHYSTDLEKECGALCNDMAPLNLTMDARNYLFLSKLVGQAFEAHPF